MSQLAPLKHLLPILFSTVVLSACGDSPSQRAPSPPIAGDMTARSICDTSIVIIKRHIGSHIRNGGAACSARSTGGRNIQVDYAYTIPARVSLTGESFVWEYSALGSVSGSRLTLSEIEIKGNTDGYIPINEL